MADLIVRGGTYSRSGRVTVSNKQGSNLPELLPLKTQPAPEFKQPEQNRGAEPGTDGNSLGDMTAEQKAAYDAQRERLIALDNEERKKLGELQSKVDSTQSRISELQKVMNENQQQSPGTTDPNTGYFVPDPDWKPDPEKVKIYEDAYYESERITPSLKDYQQQLAATGRYYEAKKLEERGITDSYTGPTGKTLDEAKLRREALDKGGKTAFDYELAHGNISDKDAVYVDMGNGKWGYTTPAKQKAEAYRLVNEGVLTSDDLKSLDINTDLSKTLNSKVEQYAATQKQKWESKLESSDPEGFKAYKSGGYDAYAQSVTERNAKAKTDNEAAIRANAQAQADHVAQVTTIRNQLQSIDDNATRNYMVDLLDQSERNNDFTSFNQAVKSLNAAGEARLKQYDNLQMQSLKSNLPVIQKAINDIKDTATRDYMDGLVKDSLRTGDTTKLRLALGNLNDANIENAKKDLAKYAAPEGGYYVTQADAAGLHTQLLTIGFTERDISEALSRQSDADKQLLAERQKILSQLEPERVVTVESSRNEPGFSTTRPTGSYDLRLALLRGKQKPIVEALQAGIFSKDDVLAASQSLPGTVTNPELKSLLGINDTLPKSPAKVLGVTPKAGGELAAVSSTITAQQTAKSFDIPFATTREPSLASKIVAFAPKIPGNVKENVQTIRTQAKDFFTPNVLGKAAPALASVGMVTSETPVGWAALALAAIGGGVAAYQTGKALADAKNQSQAAVTKFQGMTGELPKAKDIVVIQNGKVVPFSLLPPSLEGKGKGLETYPGEPPAYVPKGLTTSPINPPAYTEKKGLTQFPLENKPDTKKGIFTSPGQAPDYSPYAPGLLPSPLRDERGQEAYTWVKGLGFVPRETVDPNYAKTRDPKRAYLLVEQNEGKPPTITNVTSKEMKDKIEQLMRTERAIRITDTLRKMREQPLPKQELSAQELALTNKRAKIADSWRTIKGMPTLPTAFTAEQIKNIERTNRQIKFNDWLRQIKREAEQNYQPKTHEKPTDEELRLTAIRMSFAEIVRDINSRPLDLRPSKEKELYISSIRARFADILRDVNSYPKPINKIETTKRTAIKAQFADILRDINRRPVKSLEQTQEELAKLENALKIAKETKWKALPTERDVKLSRQLRGEQPIDNPLKTNTNPFNKKTEYAKYLAYTYLNSGFNDKFFDMIVEYGFPIDALNAARSAFAKNKDKIYHTEKPIKEVSQKVATSIGTSSGKLKVTTIEKVELLPVEAVREANNSTIPKVRILAKSYIKLANQYATDYEQNARTSPSDLTPAQINRLVKEREALQQLAQEIDQAQRVTTPKTGTRTATKLTEIPAVKSVVRPSVRQATRTTTKTATKTALQTATQQATKTNTATRTATQMAIQTATSEATQTAEQAATRPAEATRVNEAEATDTANPPADRPFELGGNDKEKKKVPAISGEGGQFAWKQGELDDKPRFEVGTISKGKVTFENTDIKPKGAVILSGKGSAARTLRIIKGTGPTKEIIKNIGAFNAVISPVGKKKLTISFEPVDKNSKEKMSRLDETIEYHKVVRDLAKEGVSVKEVSSRKLHDYAAMNPEAAKDFGIKGYPKNTLQVDKDSTTEQKIRNLRHEASEAADMAEGEPYWPAHEKALKNERKKISPAAFLKRTSRRGRGRFGKNGIIKDYGDGVVASRRNGKTKTHLRAF